MSDRDDICLDCGAVIERATFELRPGLLGTIVGLMGRQVRCPECGFDEFRRSKTCCQKPYRDPWERHTKDGRAPEHVRRDLEEMKNGRCEDGLTGGSL